MSLFFSTFFSYTTLFTTNLVSPFGSTVSVQDPGEYVSAVYIFLVTVVGCVSLGGLVYGAVVFMTSGGSSKRRSDGIRRMIESLLGLLLLISAALILRTINPALLGLDLDIPPAPPFTPGPYDWTPPPVDLPTIPTPPAMPTPPPTPTPIVYCNLPWGGRIPSGVCVNAYNTPTVGCGHTCNEYDSGPAKYGSRNYLYMESRCCQADGTLSGSYTYATCRVECVPPPCCGDCCGVPEGSSCGAALGPNCGTREGVCRQGACDKTCPFGWMRVGNKCMDRSHHDDDVPWSAAGPGCARCNSTFPTVAELVALPCAGVSVRPSGNGGIVKTATNYATGHMCFIDDFHTLAKSRAGCPTTIACGSDGYSSSPGCIVVGCWLPDDRTDYGYVCLRPQGPAQSCIPI